MKKGRREKVNKRKNRRKSKVQDTIKDKIIEELRKREAMTKRGKVKNEELRTYFYNKSIVETFRKGRPTLTPLKNRKRQKERKIKNTKNGNW